MKILVACSTTVMNPYISQLVDGLSYQDGVQHATRSLSAFWMGPSDFDVLHIQWPEALFRWKEPSEWDLGYLRDKLVEWQRRSLIVTTVHNLLPHEQATSSGRLLYDTVYEHSDGLIHLGKASLEAVADHFDVSDKEHVIIPHGNYDCFPNEITKAKARSHLDIGSKDAVYLSFGAIRRWEELELLIDGFNALNQPSKQLLIAGRIPWPSTRNKRWWWLKWNLLKPRIHLFDGWIPDDEVRYYLNAADVVIIPRIDTLNSGNVALGFTFGKVVVGPNIGVIGEVLLKTGNPTFDPKDPDSLAASLKKASHLEDNSHGAGNMLYAEGVMSWGNIAAQHIDFYQHH